MIMMGILITGILPAPNWRALMYWRDLPWLCLLSAILLVGILISNKTGVLELRKRTGIILAVICGVSLVTFLSLFAVGRYEAYKVNRQAQIRQLYGSQNYAFSCHNFITHYIPYNLINEPELYCALHRYESFSGRHLDINSIQEYLSQEYTEDGELMVEHTPEDIQKYIDWYSEYHGNVLGYGADMVDDYIQDVEEFYIDNQTENYIYPSLWATTLAEIEEIVRAYEEDDEIDYSPFLLAFDFEYPEVANTLDYSSHEPIPSDEFYEGNSIEFGAYRNNVLIWNVIAVEDDRALLLLSDVLRTEDGAPDEMLYNNEPIPATWAECSLRNWLNGEFYENAFGDDRDAIVEVLNINEDTWHSDGGEDTYDKVFLLSIGDIQSYQVSGNELFLTDSSVYYYFLRNMAFSNEEAAVFWNVEGDITPDNLNSRLAHIYLQEASCIRPAVWVDINYWR